tara:strand:+ start:353 stop:562 length:210 start_codon:yes stop_codon:yes gene_type:complete
MRFIPGTRFINKTGTNTKLFANNKLYVLQDIKKLEGGIICYTFLVENELKQVKFESFKQAESWLETILI